MMTLLTELDHFTLIDTNFSVAHGNKALNSGLFSTDCNINIVQINCRIELVEIL